MIPSLLVSFREILEAALIVGIVLSYLARIKQTKYNNIVYLAVGAGTAVSVVIAYLFIKIAGGFSGTGEQIFEGIIMFVGAILLTTMIIWMAKQGQIAKKLENQISTEIAGAHRAGLFFLVFFSVLREGVETVVFLRAASFVSSKGDLIGAILGIFGAIVLGYFIFVGSMKINLKKFFIVTNILLILFAAGLVIHGTHEFQEAKLLPVGIEHVWDINPAPQANGSPALLDDHGSIGGILRGLFGYTGSPSSVEIISYVGYLVLVGLLWKFIAVKKTV